MSARRAFKSMQTNDPWALESTFMAPDSNESSQLESPTHEVYLFLHKMEMDQEGLIRVPQMHWSTDPSGQIPMSAEAVEALGLETSIEVVLGTRSWEAYYYKALCELHHTCGFDPHGDEIARFLDLPLYEVVNTEPCDDTNPDLCTGHGGTGGRFGCSYACSQRLNNLNERGMEESNNFKDGDFNHSQSSLVTCASSGICNGKACNYLQMTSFYTVP